MQIRSLLLAISFVFLGSNFSPGLCQENPQAKVDRLMTQIYSLPNLPKLTPIKVCIDRMEAKKSGYAFYRRYPKRFFGLKTSKIPEIHLSEEFVNNNPDSVILVTLAHELGHHFDPGSKLYLEPETPLEDLIWEFDRTTKQQYFAEAFAFYILGEDLYKKGHLEQTSVLLKNMGVYWLYVETNPILHKYYTDWYELWNNYWLDGAKSRLNDIIRLVQEQQTQP